MKDRQGVWKKSICGWLWRMLIIDCLPPPAVAFLLWQIHLATIWKRETFLLPCLTHKGKNYFYGCAIGFLWISEHQQSASTRTRIQSHSIEALAPWQNHNFVWVVWSGCAKKRGLLVARQLTQGCEKSTWHHRTSFHGCYCISSVIRCFCFCFWHFKDT